MKKKNVFLKHNASLTYEHCWLKCIKKYPRLGFELFVFFKGGG